MDIRYLRFAVRAAVFVVLPLVGLSCDAFNPTFVNQIGGDTTAAIPQPSGSIVIVFNNQLATPMTLSYTYDTSTPSGTVTATTTTLTNAGGHPLMVTYGCNTTKIEITDVSSGASTSQPATSQPSAGALTATFTAPNLQCGCVIFVNVPILGAPTATIIP